MSRETFLETAARYQRLKNTLDAIPGPAREGSSVESFNNALVNSVSKTPSPGLQAALDDVRLEINVSDLKFRP